MQVDPDVFAALPKELQDELKSAYSRANNIQPQAKTGELTLFAFCLQHTAVVPS